MKLLSTSKQTTPDHSSSKVLGLFVILALTALALGSNIESANAQNKLVIQADLGEEKIDKNIYGHFSEHLGRCIY